MWSEQDLRRWEVVELSDGTKVRAVKGDPPGRHSGSNYREIFFITSISQHTNRLFAFSMLSQTSSGPRPLSRFGISTA